MALPPHWLDDIFRNPQTAERNFASHPKVKHAFAAAAAAYHETQKTLNDNPGMCGGGPDQMARAAFLEIIDPRETY